ncbi:DUF6177 family protein [Streptomyces sp. DT224]|uniref:DUF6177 family protein n=1 Tax=Streptomyces sp. DT224 TaxID=3393426 RepID=UPI003CF17FD4
MLQPPPVPVSLTLGPDAVAGLGLARVREAVAGVTPRRLGRPSGRACTSCSGTVVRTPCAAREPPARRAAP